MSSPPDDQTPVPESYARTAPPALAAPALDGTMRCDVAVVGAGYTGLSAALHLAERGIAVAVVEAREVGWGGSGRAFGQVVPYAKHGPAHILAHFGPEYGERLIAALGEGPELVFDLIARHGIACEPVRKGLLFAAHTPQAEVQLEAQARFWQERGAPVSLLRAAECERLIGSGYYPAALLEGRGGYLNPLGYARGLARAALKAGAQLFEQSRARSLTRRNGRWLVEAGRGTLEAESVVLASDAYTDGLWPGLARSLVALRGYQLVSAVLGDNLKRGILPGGHALTDTRRLYSGIRLRADGRLHVSADGPAFSAGADAYRAKTARRVKEVFPAIGDVVWEEQVAGWVAMTEDQYPHLHELAPGLFAALGLSGRGIAFGTLLGREVAKRITGRPEAECILPLTPLRPIRLVAAARPLVAGLVSLYRLLDRIELARGYVRPGA